MGVLKIALRYGPDCEPREKMAGHWMVWLNGDGDAAPTRYERIKRREGKVLIGERHIRQHLSEVWILAGDYDLDAYWPQWEGLGCQPLPRAEALEVVSQAIEASERALREASDGE